MAATKTTELSLDQQSALPPRVPEITEFKARGLSLRAIARQLRMPSSSVHKVLNMTPRPRPQPQRREIRLPPVLAIAPPPPALGGIAWEHRSQPFERIFKNASRAKAFKHSFVAQRSPGRPLNPHSWRLRPAWKLSWHRGVSIW